MTETSELYFGTRPIGPMHPTYIIAEIGVNHNGDLDLAHQLVDLAVDSGVDAVKFQTYVTDELILSDTRLARYQAEQMSDSTQADMLRRYELPFSAFIELKTHCDKVNIDFISTAFDAPSLDFVVSLAPVCLKWASGELTNIPLLYRAKKTGLPILLSTGMGTLDEIEEALERLGESTEVVILQCVSNYPAAIEDQNLRVLPVMQDRFRCPVGFSDHTIGPYAAIAAKPLGMAVLEKHFTLDTSLPGPDHAASATPEEFRQLVTILRQIEAGLGDGIKRPRAVEKDVQEVARKSLVYQTELSKGHVLTPEDMTAKRPGIGLAPIHYDSLIGRELVRTVKRNQLIQMSDVRESTN